MMEWLAMGGYGAYVWGSYAVVAAAVGVECWRLGARRRNALARARIEAGANGAA